jgi:hypothetical protein
MEIKRAKSLVCNMLDICAELQDESFSETCSGIYNDVQAAKTIENVIACARELMVFVNEQPWEDLDLAEFKEEIESIFNTLMEESEEF